VPWFHAAAALADYRRGEFGAAEESAALADETTASTPPQTRDAVRALAGGVRTLAQVAMGHRDEAQATVDAARKHLSRILQRRPDGTIVGTSLVGDNGGFDHDGLIADIVIPEAETALDR
jgi:hypothetical protein